MSAAGHNGGPTLEGGHSWRRHAWGKARADLLPKLPLEILRTRVARAKELGIEYKSYASIRATSGRDVIAFLFSSNALRVSPRIVTIPAARAAKLENLTRCTRLAMAQPPLDPAALLAANPSALDGTHHAPTLRLSWSETRDALLAATAGQGLPTDAIVVIGETALEREWTSAGKMAGFIPAAHYFQETRP